MLRKELPPNYLFEDDDAVALPDDLTQLLICLTGSESTPYSEGLWRLSLRIPTDYPRSPPTATFLTRIFHPNVDEHTGAVCLETLKRDWDPKLTLKDILVTISCLLIQPNPDSALNSKAGLLIQEDYDAFTKQARLMTRIHAAIPASLYTLAHEARQRGESDGALQVSANIARSHDQSTSGKLRKRPSGSQQAATSSAPKRAHPNTVCPGHFTEPVEDIGEPRHKSPKTEVTPSNDASVLLKSTSDSSQRDISCAEPLQKSPALPSTRLVFNARLIRGNTIARVGLRRL